MPGRGVRHGERAPGWQRQHLVRAVCTLPPPGPPGGAGRPPRCAGLSPLITASTAGVARVARDRGSFRNRGAVRALPTMVFPKGYGQLYSLPDDALLNLGQCTPEDLDMNNDKHTRGMYPLVVHIEVLPDAPSAAADATPPGKAVEGVRRGPSRAARTICSDGLAARLHLTRPPPAPHGVSVRAGSRRRCGAARCSHRQRRSACLHPRALQQVDRVSGQFFQLDARDGRLRGQAGRAKDYGASKSGFSRHSLRPAPLMAAGMADGDRRTGLAGWRPAVLFARNLRNRACDRPERGAG